MRRNLYIGRSPATGLLPQAEAHRSPWQPCHSDGQHRVGAGRAAALSHRPPALMGNHRPPPNVVPVVQSSFTFSGVFVCLSKKKGVFSRLMTPSVPLHIILPEGLRASRFTACVRSVSNTVTEMSRCMCVYV